MIKKLVSFLVICAITSPVLFSQTILYQNDFTAGSAGWQLGQGGNFNTWTVNNVYNCSFPTPDQGGGNYLHVYDDLSPDYCAVYNILGFGSGGTVHAAMTSDFSTMGEPSVTIQFDWLCAGQPGSVLPSFGFIDYSTDNGITWTNITQPIAAYSGQSAWTSQTITSAQIPGLLNQASLRLRFGFTSSGYGQNPGFGIDNLLVTGGIATNLNALNSQKGFSVLPNPSNGIFTIKSNSRIAEINVFDMTGTLVYSETPLATESEINLNGKTKGFYLVQVVSNESVYSKRLFIH